MATVLDYIEAPGSFTAHYHITTESVSSDGQYAEWIIGDETNTNIFGLSSQTSANISTYEALVWPINASTGEIQIAASGSIIATITPGFALHDRFRLTRSGTTLILSKNGTTVYTYTGIAAGTLYAHSYNSDGTGLIYLNSVNGSIVSTRASASVTVTLTAPSTDYYANNSSLLFSQLNWLSSGRYKESAQPGAFMRFKFTGTSAKIIYDARRQTAQAPGLKTFLAYRIDGGSWTRFELSDANQNQLEIATGLSSGTHEAEVQIAESSYGTRWSTTATNRTSSVLLYGVRLPATESLVATTARPLTILWYGDSNSQGAESIYPNSSAQVAYSSLIAEGLYADLWLVSYPGQGWITTAGSNVPTFQNAWDLLPDGSAISIATQPDFIVIRHGQNDSSSVTSAATSTVNEILAATTGKVVIMCPTGRHRRSELIATQAAVNNARCLYFDNPSDWLASYGANGGTTHLTSAGHALDATTQLPKFASVIGDEVLTLIADIQTEIEAIRAKTDLIGTATIYPLTGTVTATANASYISIRTSEAITVTIALYDSAGTAVSTVGMTLELVFESGSTEVVIANASITKSATGFSFTVPSTLNSSERLWTYTCRKTSDEAVLCSGKLEVIYAPNN